MSDEKFTPLSIVCDTCGKRWSIGPPMPQDQLVGIAQQAAYHVCERQR